MRGCLALRALLAAAPNALPRARLNGPQHASVDEEGRVLIRDTESHRAIRIVKR